MTTRLKSRTVNHKLPILVGPTGVGKSEVAVRLAERIGAEILSADAFQVFKGLEVGTAQPSKELRERVKHQLIGVLEPGEPWNAVEFARRASVLLWEGLGRGKRFVVVGGAGFYLKALVEGPPEGAGSSVESREIANSLRRLEALAHLKEHDAKAAGRLKDADLKRIRRAVEKTLMPNDTLPIYKALGRGGVRFFGLERSRERLDERLRERTKAMWAGGLLAETNRLQESGPRAGHPIWTAIGYQEAGAFLRGEMTEKDALERIFRRTRQYAKRQWTWFRHQHEVEWIDLDRFGEVEGVVEELIGRIERE
jgi:tRNA dimethylallyltransferase